MEGRSKVSFILGGTRTAATETRRKTVDPAWRSPSLAMEKTELIQKAELAKQAECYGDMAST